MSRLTRYSELMTTKTTALTFDKIGRGIYRTRIADTEIQARKVDDLWVLETRSWTAGGPFTVRGWEKTLTAAKHTAQRTADRAH